MRFQHLDRSFHTALEYSFVGYANRCRQRNRFLLTGSGEDQ